MDTSPASNAPARMSVQHKLFDIVVILKGLNGALELIGGAALALIPTAEIVTLVDYLTRTELSKDPGDFVATHLMHWAENFGQGAQMFAAMYLLFHGVAKVTLATLLFRGMKIAYPIALVFFSAFVLYALHRLSLHWSWVLAAFTALDVFTIWVIAREWRADGAEPVSGAVAAVKP